MTDKDRVAGESAQGQPTEQVVSKAADILSMQLKGMAVGREEECMLYEHKRLGKVQ